MNTALEQRAAPRVPVDHAVRGAIAVFAPGGAPDESAIDRLERAARGPARRRGPLAVAARGLPGESWWEDSRWLCLIDGRLHDVDDLARELSLPASAPHARLLAAALDRWGAAAPERLRGSYAFVAWDAERHQAIWGQDHLGARTLYMLQDAGRWLIGSELRLVLDAATMRPPPDRGGVEMWLAGRAMHGGQMLHAGVRRLGGAHVITGTAAGAVARPYWEPRYEGRLDVSRDEAAELLRDALVRAVRRRMLPDESLAVLLSGGMDSSSVAACAIRLCQDVEPDLTAYSIVLPDEPVVDETPWVDAITAGLELPGVRVIPSGSGALWNGWWFQEAFGVPMLSPNIVLDQPLVELAAERGADAVLDGQGGDELFGMDPYLLADYMRRGRPWATRRLLKSYPWFGTSPTRPQLRHMLRSYGFRGNTPAFYDSWRLDTTQFFTPPWLPDDASARLLERANPFAWKRRPGPRAWAHLAWLLVEGRDVVWAEDFFRRRSALAGVDARCPMFDVDLVSTVLRLPPQYAFDPVYDRALLRHALRGVLPEPVRLRKRKSRYLRFNHEVIFPACEPALTALITAPDAEVRAYVREDVLDDRMGGGRPPLEAPGSQAWALEAWNLVTAEMWLRSEAGRGDEVVELLERTARPAERVLTSPWRP